MQSKIISALGKRKGSDFLKFVRANWVLNEEGQATINDVVIANIEDYLNKHFPDYETKIGDIRAWLPLLIKQMSGNLDESDIDTVHEQVTYQLQVEKNDIGFNKSINFIVKEKSLLSEETLKYISPTVKELQEGMNILVEFEAGKIDESQVVATGTIETATDALEGAIKGLDKLLGVSNEELVSKETGWYEEPEDIKVFYPRLEHKEYQQITTWPVEFYYESRRTKRWTVVQLKDLLEGKFDSVVDAVLPLSLSPMAMVKRIQSLSSVVQNHKLIMNIYEQIITPRIIKGRTFYNTRSIVFISEIISDIDKSLSRIDTDSRIYVALPLLALIVAELKRTGLLAIDFNFAIMVPMPEHVSPDNIIIKHMLKDELRQSLEAYSQATQKLEFGESVVSAYDIAQTVSSVRHMLGEDMLNLEYTLQMYSTVKKIAAGVLFKLPTKLLMTHPSIKQSAAVKYLMSIYDFIMEITSDSTTALLHSDDVSYEEATEVLNWFMLRTSTLRGYIKPLSDLKKEFSITYRHKNNGLFSNVIIYRDTVGKHENTVSSFVRYGSGSTFALYKRRREDLEKRFNSISNSMVSKFAKEGLFEKVEEELQRGYLPPYMGVISATQRETELLACALNDNLVTIGHQSIMSEILKDGHTIMGKTLIIPTEAERTYIIVTDNLRVNGMYFPTQNITVTDPATYLWAKIQQDEIRSVASNVVQEHIDVDKLPEGTRAILPFSISPKALEAIFQIQVTFREQQYDIDIDLKSLFQSELIIGSHMIPKLSSSAGVIKALTLLDILNKIGTSNLNKITGREAIGKLERAELSLSILRMLFNSSLEMRSIVNRIMSHIELRIARSLGQLSTELDVLSLKEMHNNIAAQVIACMAELLGVAPASLINNIASIASESRAWYSMEVFS